MILAEIASVLTPIGVIVTAVLGYANNRRINNVHDRVNGNMSAQTQRIEQLATTLTANDIPVPSSRNPKSRTRVTDG